MTWMGVFYLSPVFILDAFKVFQVESGPVIPSGLRKAMMLYHENVSDKKPIFESNETVCFVNMKQESILFIYMSVSKRLRFLNGLTPLK